MKFTTSLLALASLAAAAPSGGEESPLDVKLEMAGNSAVKAIITNVGKESLKLLKAGSLLDNVATQKAAVSRNDKAVKFEGVRGRVKTTGLEEDAFQRIAAGESVNVTFDLTEAHDLSAGGKLSIASSGFFRYAEDGKTTLAGSVRFQSNQIEADVDGAVADAVRAALLETRMAQRRSIISSDCTGDQLSAIRAGFSGSVALAKIGKDAAASASSAKMKEFFKSDSQATRNKVAAVFGASATECGATSNAATVHCADIYNDCQGRYLAFTYPATSEMVYCPSHFATPATTTGCYDQSQENTILHESTHLTYVGDTEDYAYGYDDVVRLSTQKALANADTYAIFAQAVSQGC